MAFLAQFSLELPMTKEAIITVRFGGVEENRKMGTKGILQQCSQILNTFQADLYYLKIIT